MEGDKNTSFFHRKAFQHHKRNTSTHLKNSYRLEISDPKEIKLAIFNYIQSIFTSNNSSYALQDRKIHQVQSSAKVDSLPKPFSPDDVLIVLKHVKGRKTRRLEGFQACFLQKYCYVLGTKVTHMVLGILKQWG